MKVTSPAKKVFKKQTCNDKNNTSIKNETKIKTVCEFVDKDIKIILQ